MKNRQKTGFLQRQNPSETQGMNRAVSLHPHKPPQHSANPVFPSKGRQGDADRVAPNMRKYTIPAIRTTDPKKWYIEFYYQVPPELREFYSKPLVRFKKYGDHISGFINSIPQKPVCLTQSDLEMIGRES